MLLHAAVSDIRPTTIMCDNPAAVSALVNPPDKGSPGFRRGKNAPEFVAGDCDIEETCGFSRRRATLETVKHTLSWGFISAVRAIWRSDRLVIGPGGIIEDATGISLFGGNIPSVACTVFVAACLRKKIAFYAVGVGPITSTYGKMLARMMLSQASLITVRDAGSVNNIAALGVNTKVIHDISDPTVLMQLPHPSLCAAKNPRLRIGVSLRPLPGYTSGEKIDALSTLCDYMIAELHASIVFLPFDYEEDPALIAQVRARMRQYTPEPSCFPAIDDVGAIISTLDFVVGMRLHSLILSAAVMEKPVIAIAYDDKVRFFMDSIGQHDHVLSVDELYTDRARDMLRALIASLPHLIAEIAEKSKGLRKKAEFGRALMQEFVS